MTEQLPISLKNVKEVNQFVNIISNFDSDFDLYCGNYCVDAKSLLGIMTMDLQRELLLKGNCDKKEEEMLKEELGSFLAA